MTISSSANERKEMGSQGSFLRILTQTATACKGHYN